MAMSLGTEITLKAADQSIRIWRFGKSNLDGRALVVLDGDAAEPKSGQQLAAQEASFARALHALKQASRTHRMPVYFLARPGYLGSAGKRRDKWRHDSVNVVAWAIDELAKREKLSNWALVGQSGGTVPGMGHIRYGSYPADCYVMISGVYSIYHMMAYRHLLPKSSLPTDMTFRRSIPGTYDILPHIGEIPSFVRSRFIFIADPQDAVAGYFQSLMLHEALGHAGFQSTLKTVTTNVARHHALLSAPALRDAVDCLDDTPLQQN
jgi:hypothetical protein